jgi:Ohr subfamily peroxiredoxin
MGVLYTSEAISTGAGRNGRVRTTSGHVRLDLSTPTELGGSGEGTNPEELFAAGYAACFHSALQRAARMRKVAIANSTVGSRVHLVTNGNGGFTLAVDLEVVLPDVDPKIARELADEAHDVCPYSNATRGNITVNLTVGDD